MSIRLVIVLASLTLVTACGSSAGGGAGPGPGTSSTGTGTTGTGTTGTGTTSTGTTTGDATFPVTISRSGGIAGFNDRIVVDTGGATTVTSKRGTAGRCTLTADTLARLLAAVGALPKAGSPTTTGPQIADEMFTTVEAPGTKGPVRLADATGADLAVVGDIIIDVTGASPAYRLCVKA